MKQQKICIIGNGLAGLISAAVLSKEDIKIDLIFPKAKSIKIDHRTTAISESNYSFLKKELNFKNLKYVWSSKKINLFETILYSSVYGAATSEDKYPSVYSVIASIASVVQLCSIATSAREVVKSSEPMMSTTKRLQFVNKGSSVIVTI